MDLVLLALVHTVTGTVHQSMRQSLFQRGETARKAFSGMRNMKLRRRSHHRNYQVRIKCMKWLDEYVVLMMIGDCCHRYAQDDET
jgi:hypothetical protein